MLTGNFKTKNQFLLYIFKCANFFGFWQSYNFFAPDVCTINFSVEAKIDFTDGTNIIWLAPLSNKNTENFLDSLARNRYKKLIYEYLIWQEYQQLRPYFARYLWTKYSTSNKTPQRISLIRRWRQIPSPSNIKIESDTTLKENQTFYIYEGPDKH